MHPGDTQFHTLIFKLNIFIQGSDRSMLGKQLAI
jgi:hypothetical protein